MQYNILRRNYADVAQLVECVLGKDEVVGSIPIISSTKTERLCSVFVFLLNILIFSEVFSLANRITMKTRRLVYTSLLAALMIVMHYTFGYLTTGGLEICFLMVPVLIGAVLVGPACGTFLGALFGLSSFLSCLGVGHPSAFGATLFSIQPVHTVVLCFIPRILMGFLVGWIYRWIVRKSHKTMLSVLIASFSGAFLNTLFFMSALILLFGSSDYIQGIAAGLGAADNVLKFVALFVGVNGLIEAAACLIIGTALSRALLRYFPATGEGDAV